MFAYIRKVKNKVWFKENFKLPKEAGMLFTIYGDKFYFFTKNMWIGDSGALCHIKNNDDNLFGVIDIDESIKGSFRNMPAIRKGKV